MKKEEIIEILKLMKEILNDNQINKEEVKKNDWGESFFLTAQNSNDEKNKNILKHLLE